MLAFLSLTVLVATVSQSGPSIPPGTPAEQVGAIRAGLEAARAEYIRKFENATTTAQRDQLLKEAPLPDPYAESMLQIADQHPKDPAALTALLWVVGNTAGGSETSANARAKTRLMRDFATSDQLTPLAVALAWSANAADEEMLRQILTRNQTDQVRAAASYSLARQLLAQADMIDLYQVRLAGAANDQAKRHIRKSLDLDFGPATARRLLDRDARALTTEASQLLQNLLANDQFAAATWPANGSNQRLGDLAKQELQGQKLSPGNPAPAIQGSDLRGKPFSRADYQGKVVLLIFGGHWCVACRGLYPLERELSAKHAGRPFTVLGVNTDSTREIALKTADAEKMTWPVLWDGASKPPLATTWNVRAWPLVVLIDHQGTIRYKFNGAPASAILTPLVEKLLAEAEATTPGK